MKVAFITHFCPHYRVKTFELLAQRHDVQYLFYSPGNEWYGQGIHGVRGGQFRYKYLRGFQVTDRMRVTPSLVADLWRKDYDVLVKCINGRFALPASYLIARLRGIPFVLWTGIWSSVQTPVHRAMFPLTRWIYRHADAIAVYGEHVSQYLLEQGVKKEKIFVAAHAVDNPVYSVPVSEHDKATLRRKLNIEGKRVLLYLGRLEHVKGIEYLLRSVGDLKRDDVALVLAGSGSLYHPLLQLSQQLGISEKVRFAGYVPPQAAPPYYAIADLFVLPSITLPAQKETWGLVINEAMNQGLPIVATNAVGAAAGGLVQSGVNGFIVPERDSAALGQAIERILADSRLRTEMGNNARQVITQWDNERMVRGFEQAIEYAVQARYSVLVRGSAAV